MSFEIIDVDALGRIGTLSVNDKEMITPNLFPVVHPYKNVVSTSELEKIGAECLFTNAYIIYQNDDLKEKILQEGLSKHLSFKGLIATDSGAFQQYMYQDNKIIISAEEIEQFQERIGSDFPVILDIPVQLDDNYEIAEQKVLTTLKRAKENITRRRNESCCWFGPIHGGRHLDLVEKSALEMNKLDFGVFAIGGLVKAFLEYRFDLTIRILLTAKQKLAFNKPVHMFGLGLPQFFSLAVACGCDLMDSAAYILYAKENRYFTLSTGTKTLEELQEFPCHCPVCIKYNPRELQELEDSIRIQLLAKHNLYTSFSELRTIRQAIREGNLWELVEQRVRFHPALVKAVRIVEDYNSHIEKYEKSYKNHGRLYVSNESINRPLLKRYEQRISINYRVPEDVKYLIILPELDVKSESSPSISEWLEKVDGNTVIQRKLIHIAFYSDFYGIIPMELMDTFPMGQYESIHSIDINDVLHLNSVEKLKIFIKKHINYYKKCGILIPEEYINQLNEKVPFSDQFLRNLISILKKDFKLNIISSNQIEDLLQALKE